MNIRTVFLAIHQEEAEYSAYQAKKRSELSEALSQMSPTKLGGKKLDGGDIATMRERQEKEVRLAAKFESIRKRVSSVALQLNITCMLFICRRRESSISLKKDRERIRFMKLRNRRQENRLTLVTCLCVCLYVQ